MRKTPTIFLATLAALALLAAACSGDASDDSGAATSVPVADPTSETSSTDSTGTSESVTDGQLDPTKYQATIARTEHNIPHITAADMGGLGFGYGYAFSQDHACSLADVVIRARGELALFHGAGDGDANLRSDTVHKSLDLYERARVEFDQADAQLQEVIIGYAAGYNHHLDEVGGADGVTGWCQGEPWVRAIDQYDLAAYYKLLTWRASIDPLLDRIYDAQPPDGDAAAGTEDDGSDDGEAGPALGPILDEPTIAASNGWAVGPTRTADGTTMLVGNPHFPWQGSLRFYEVHLTVPDQINVYGASLLGSPAVNIGFTDGVAWTHTVSAGNRFNGYSLTLVPGSPTTYVYGDEVREMSSIDVSVEVLTDAGVESVTRTMWSSHYGPIINVGEVGGWTDTTTYSFRDANAENDEILEQYFAMNQSQDMDQLIAAHRDIGGIPWVNTVAASADGRIWYADTSAAPNLSPETIELFNQALEDDIVVAGFAAQRLLLLDGSNPVNEWVDDPEARDPGVVPFSAMPQLERDDFVFNANDPYWLANPDELQVLDSPVFGFAEQAVSPRTRMNAVQLGVESGDAGPDGLFTRAELAASALGNRVYTAEILVDEVVERCEPNPTGTVDGVVVALDKACDVLASWDRRVNTDSVGAIVWREFIESFGNDAFADAGELFAVPFDVTDPVNTPRGLADGPQILDTLAAVVQALERAGIPLDTPLGNVQFAQRGTQLVPLGGGTGKEGVTNVIGEGSNSTTTEPDIERGDRYDGLRLREEGYPIMNGTSFIYNLEFTAAGPVAEALLTYGESGDPTSPFYSDQTELFGRGQWRPVRFTADDVAENTVETIEISADRG